MIHQHRIPPLISKATHRRTRGSLAQGNAVPIIVRNDIHARRSIRARLNILDARVPYLRRVRRVALFQYRRLLAEQERRGDAQRRRVRRGFERDEVARVPGRDGEDREVLCGFVAAGLRLEFCARSRGVDAEAKGGVCAERRDQ